MKKTFLFCIILLSLNIYSQKNIEFSLQQDFRLLFLGDDKGNDALTINVLSKLEIPVINVGKNYITAYASVEYADLVGKDFKRYSLGAGYVIEKLFRKFGAGAYFDFGKIYREKEGFNSFSFSGELSYRLSNKLKVLYAVVSPDTAVMSGS